MKQCGHGKVVRTFFSLLAWPGLALLQALKGVGRYYKIVRRRVRQKARSDQNPSALCFRNKALGVMDGGWRGGGRAGVGEPQEPHPHSLQILEARGSWVLALPVPGVLAAAFAAGQSWGWLGHHSVAGCRVMRPGVSNPRYRPSTFAAIFNLEMRRGVLELRLDVYTEVRRFLSFLPGWFKISAHRVSGKKQIVG